MNSVHRLIFAGTAFILGVASGPVGQVSAKESMLPCAVLGTGSAGRAKALCQAVGRELGQAVSIIDDGRSVRRGEALHIEQGDVSWTVIWLRDGRARAFTRVSAVEAEGREALFLARASRAVKREARKVSRECLRVEPNGGRRMRVAELAYPWAELRTCRAHFIDVLDPWWSAPG
jgi:hypothetical protein